MPYNMNEKRTKIIKDVDHATWREFVFWCGTKGKKVGHALSDVIFLFNKQNKEEEHNKVKESGGKNVKKK